MPMVVWLGLPINAILCAAVAVLRSLYWCASCNRISKVTIPNLNSRHIIWNSKMWLFNIPNKLTHIIIIITVQLAPFHTDVYWFCSLMAGLNNKGRYSSSWEPHLRATGRHLPYGITQCYLPPDTSERAPPNPGHAGWYSIYLPWGDGRLSWPRSFVTFRDDLPAHRWSPIQVLTGLSVD